METKKKLIDFFKQEHVIKPCKDSCFSDEELKKFEIDDDSEFTVSETLSFANAFANQQTTSQQQTIERLREVLQKLCYLNSREQEGIADAMPLPEDWYKTFLQAEQLLNTTEPTKSRQQ